MSQPARELARREPAAADILGTGDLPLMLEQARKNVNLAIEIARRQGFVTDYEVKNKAGEVVGYRPWFHHPMWQLIGQAWNITAFTEGEATEVKPGTWQAAAVAKMVEDGRIVGRAVGLCARSEPGKKYKGDHELAATAQSRAQRNALRSCLGALLVAAAPELEDLIYDPDGPASRRQKGHLHQLERELEWSHERGHQEAGVESYSELTGEQAHELIERWMALRDNVKTDVGDHTVSGSAVDPFSGEPERPSSAGGETPDAGEPPEEPEPLRGRAGTATQEAPASLGELWKRAAAAGLTSNKAKAFARSIGIKVQSASDLDVEQMQKVLAGWEGRKG